MVLVLYNCNAIYGFVLFLAWCYFENCLTIIENLLDYVADTSRSFLKLADHIVKTLGLQILIFKFRISCAVFLSSCKIFVVILQREYIIMYMSDCKSHRIRFRIVTKILQELKNAAHKIRNLKIKIRSPKVLTI